MNRLLAITRNLLLVGPGTLGWPLGVLGIVLALNVAIFALVGRLSGGEAPITGGLSALYITVGIAFAQIVTQVFPLSLGLGVTRRAFAAAVGLAVAGQGVGIGLLLLALHAVEGVTGGWGVGMAFFALPFLDGLGVFGLLAAYTVPLVVVSLLGAAGGVVYLRWRVTGMYVATIGGAVAIVGFAALVTWRDAWPAVGSFFETQAPLSLLAGWPLALAVLAAGGAWLGLRRATP